MNYSDGVQHMKKLASQLAQGEKSSFSVGELVINYPGFKKIGDYQLTINGRAPKHTDIVIEIFEVTNDQNIESVIAFLDDVYRNGLTAKSPFFSKEYVEKIYWITLQEEINYPQPMYKGRKLPFQRFYEGALAKVTTIVDLETVLYRTNNHGKVAPVLLSAIEKYTVPSFYN